MEPVDSPAAYAFRDRLADKYVVKPALKSLIQFVFTI